MKERMYGILNILMFVLGLMLTGWCVGFLIRESYLHYRQHQRISAIEQDLADGQTPASMKFRHDFIGLITHAANVKLCSETIDDTLSELLNNSVENLRVVNVDYIQEQSQTHNAILKKYMMLIRENCK